MAKKSTKSPVKRLGVRYGRTVRKKLGVVEIEQKKKHISPFTKRPTVKRLSAGIWYCTKSGKKFTSKAYTVSHDAFKQRRDRQDVQADSTAPATSEQKEG